MPAVPALIMAGGAVASGVLSSRAAKSAAKLASTRSPEELAQIQSQTQLSDQLRRQGSEMFGRAMPGMQSTLNYYQTLLNGGRAARMNATSGEAQDTAQSFAGADRAVNQTLRGGERDQALAENSRAKAGSIARLVTGVRPQAAGALSNLSTSLLGGSTGASGGAAGIGAELLSNSTQNRQFGVGAGQQAGATTASNIGKLLSQIMNGYGKPGTGGGGGGTRFGGLAGPSAGSGGDPLGSIGRLAR